MFFKGSRYARIPVASRRRTAADGRSPTRRTRFIGPSESVVRAHGRGGRQARPHRARPLPRPRAVLAHLRRQRGAVAAGPGGRAGPGDRPSSRGGPSVRGLLPPRARRPASRSGASGRDRANRGRGPRRARGHAAASGRRSSVSEDGAGWTMLDDGPFARLAKIRVAAAVGSSQRAAVDRGARDRDVRRAVATSRGSRS